jgi:hypothetical protein
VQNHSARRAMRASVQAELVGIHPGRQARAHTHTRRLDLGHELLLSLKVRLEVLRLEAVSVVDVS